MITTQTVYMTSTSSGWGTGLADIEPTGSLADIEPTGSFISAWIVQDHPFDLVARASHWFKGSSGRVNLALDKFRYYYVNPAQPATSLHGRVKKL